MGFFFLPLFFSILPPFFVLPPFIPVKYGFSKEAEDRVSYEIPIPFHGGWKISGEISL